MKTVIINQNGASVSELSDLVKSLGACNVLIIGSEAPSGFTGRFISESSFDRNAELRSFMGNSQSSSILCIDGNLPQGTASSANTLSAMDDDISIRFSPLNNDQELDISELSADFMISAIASQKEWPITCIEISSSLLLEAMDAQSFNEALARSVIMAISRGHEIEAMGMQNSAQSGIIFSHAECSRLIEFAVGVANIEDLFPNHSWATHQDESLAACYHTLAAHFVRLGSPDAALDCLRQSDTLEDSPRSLALKGIISLLKGETLGAVANMVSSLQQYEVRKKNDGSHYLEFSPPDIEVINQKLKSGLEALNRRDNDQALEEFTDAVFRFDSFYSELGISKKPAE